MADHTSWNDFSFGDNNPRIVEKQLDEFNKNTLTKSESVFRVIMKLNTASTKVVEPALYMGGEREYVRSLFNYLGINI